MSKQFLTKKDKETILSAYSMNYEREFKKIGPYTYVASYKYMINMCPEIDEKGEETGRILVNHFKYSSTHYPVFTDVWERDGMELKFSFRNLPEKYLISENSRIKALEKELKVYQGMDKTEMEVLNLKGKKLSEYVRQQYKYWELCHNQMDRAFKVINSMKDEYNEYFKLSSHYWELLRERDDALLELEDQKKINRQLRIKITEVTEKLLEISKKLDEESQKSRPLTHNARGAGRKKDPKVIEKKQKMKELIKDGKTKEEIMQEIGISQATYFRYLREVRDMKDPKTEIKMAEIKAEQERYKTEYTIKDIVSQVEKHDKETNYTAPTLEEINQYISEVRNENR